MKIAFHNNTNDGRWRLALLPFKAYVGAVFVVVCLTGLTSNEAFDDRAAARAFAADCARIIVPLVDGLFVCVAGLLLGALLLKIYTTDKKGIWSALVWASIGFVLLGLLWPGTYIPRVK